ncbi:hypothetical protein [Roseibium sediminis]|uniref:hypothetical protein n=1 Tax=Roseibium sediminis TaxID=1775174 RepID=UPI00123DB1D5|nr:hypothetical protein [Roseibium sediminis]
MVRFFLFIFGALSVLSGLVLAFLMASFALGGAAMLSGVLIIAVAQVLGLLEDIRDHLRALRGDVGGFRSDVSRRAAPIEQAAAE